MIYVKEDNYYFRYHVSDDGRLICTANDGSESVLLYDISPEFDGVITNDKKTHFVLQGIKGELIYLKKENGTWKKYSIIKSKKGIQKITDIHLICRGEAICVFYVMHHKGNSLIVKHLFTEDDMYKEPEIIGLCDNARKADITVGNKTTLIFKTPEGEIRKIVTDEDFKKIKDEKLHTDDEILNTSSIYHNDQLYTVYTSPRKNSTVIMVCNEKNMFCGKIVTFTMARNSSPHIFFVKETLIVQWEENGVIAQAESNDFGQTFSKPVSLGGQCSFSKVRHIYDENAPMCNVCAVYNMEPYFKKQKNYGQKNIKGVKKATMQNEYTKNKINPDANTQKLFDTLDEIKNDIYKLSMSLNEICMELGTLKEHKKNVSPDSYSNEKRRSNLILSGEDIGEIDEDNIKLFENADIDTVLPDKNE